MAIKFMKADTAANMTRLLNGVVMGKRNLVMGRDQSVAPTAAPHNLFKHPVAGLKLEFSAPVKTVTFSANLDLNEIVAEINTELTVTGAHLLKMDGNGGMVLALWNDASPMTLKDTGTANSYFGFSTTAADPDLVQTAVAPTDLLQIVVEPLSRQYVAFYK
jgi:hypothetical protein